MKRFLFVVLVGLLSGQSAGQSRMFEDYRLSEQTFEAHGVKTFDDRTIYKGALRNGWLHGPGVLLMPSDRFDVQEEWQENCEQEAVNLVARMCSGRSKYCEIVVMGLRGCSDWRYEGEFHNGKFHGRGRLKNLIWLYGPIYEGEFRDGKFHGRGVLDMRPSGDGDEWGYEGEFRDGKFHGQGRYWDTWPAHNVEYGEHDKGEHYKGEFRDDKYHGQGDLEEWRRDFDEILLGRTRSVGRFRDGGFFEGVVETSSWREGEEGCFIQDVSHGEAVPGSRRPCADK